MVRRKELEKLTKEQLYEATKSYGRKVPNSYWKIKRDRLWGSEYRVVKLKGIGYFSATGEHCHYYESFGREAGFSYSLKWASKKHLIDVCMKLPEYEKYSGYQKYIKK